MSLEWKSAATARPPLWRRGRRPRLRRMSLIRAITPSSRTASADLMRFLCWGTFVRVGALCRVKVLSRSSTWPSRLPLVAASLAATAADGASAKTATRTARPARIVQRSAAIPGSDVPQKGDFRRSLRACAGFCSGSVARPPREPGEEEHLDRPGDRDRREGTEDAGELRPDQYGDQDRERGKLHRTAVDEGLQDVVLDLLVDDEEDQHDDPGRDPVDEGDGRDDDRRNRRPGEWDEIENRDEQPERNRVGNAQDQEHDRRGDPRDDADQEVARDVAADCSVDVASDPPPLVARALRNEPVHALDPRRAFEEHEEGHEGDRHDRHDEGEHTLRDCDRGARETEYARRASVRDRIPDPLLELVALRESAERATTLGDVVDVAR